jgi:glycosyltransferase involved in cell wall biosynthesis
MRLFYISNTRIPSERASAYQVMQMCAAFAAHDVQVDLLYPQRHAYGEWGAIADNFAYYGVPPSFSMLPVSCVDYIKATTIDNPQLQATPLPRVSHYVQTGTYAAQALRRLMAHRAGVCYSRDLSTLSLLRLADPQRRWRLFYEAHTTPETSWSLWQTRWMAGRLDGIVTITDSIARFYGDLGVPRHMLLTAPDGVDLDRYAKLPERTAARAHLDLPSERPLICYTGQLYRWKGVHTLIAAMTELPEASLCLVGGAPSELAEMEALVSELGLSNVILTGQVAPEIVPLYQAAADVLALPNTAQEAISREHTSPLKLFEYMAAGRPIVASDLPSLREVLRHGENGWLVPPDEPTALAQGIRHVLADAGLAMRLAAAAREEVQSYTWDRRAGGILEFVKAHATVGA